MGEQFDLVTYGDVLEHLLEPQDVLRETRNLLAPGGRVLISLPNIAFWTMRVKLLMGRFEYESMGLLDYTHLRFFTCSYGPQDDRRSRLSYCFFPPGHGCQVH